MKDLPVLTKILPQSDSIWVACSGGIDSMFAAMYLGRTRDIGLVYFNHGTPYANEAEQFVKTYAILNKLPFVRGVISKTVVPKGRSAEDFWREERYAFINDVVGGTVVTGHHLNDAVETWVWSSCHGKPTLPHLRINNVYRPFLACKKAAMKAALEKNGVKWLEDPSNSDTNYTRNHIRANVIPQLYKVNPGLDTVIQKKIKESITLELLKSNT